MELILVRHGESLGNLDRKLYLEIADHAIPLSGKGHLEAQTAAQQIQKYFNLKYRRSNQYPHIRLWSSPYLRATQTAEAILPITWQSPYSTDDKLMITDYREDIGLCEQQFGLFDGLEDEELRLKFPLEYAHYDKTERLNGKFWARMPCGESRFDVAMRVHQIFGTWQRDNIDTLIVVSHGVAIRSIIMRWLHRSVEWFEREPNPANGSVRVISGTKDLGLLK